MGFRGSRASSSRTCCTGNSFRTTSFAFSTRLQSAWVSGAAGLSWNGRAESDWHWWSLLRNWGMNYYLQSPSCYLRSQQTLLWEFSEDNQVITSYFQRVLTFYGLGLDSTGACDVFIYWWQRRAAVETPEMMIGSFLRARPLTDHMQTQHFRKAKTRKEEKSLKSLISFEGVVSGVYDVVDARLCEWFNKYIIYANMLLWLTYISTF